MKQTGQCPKCGSREILTAQGRMNDSNSILLGLSAFSRLPVTHTICCDCGYIEMWAAQEDLHYLKEEKGKRNSRGTFWK